MRSLGTGTSAVATAAIPFVNVSSSLPAVAIVAIAAALAIPDAVGDTDGAVASGAEATGAEPTATAAGTLVVGLDAGRTWRLFAREDGAAWRAIETAEEPRTPAYDPVSDTFAYVDSAGSVKAITAGAERVLLEASARVRFTQPDFSADGRRLHVVALADGSSADTDIVAVDLASGERTVVVGQRSAQFEPAAYANELLYSSVACVPPACDRVVEEIWSIDPLTARARQLTLGNAISREPVRDVASGALHFVSNRGGAFRVWTVEPAATGSSGEPPGGGTARPLHPEPASSGAPSASMASSASAVPPVPPTPSFSTVPSASPPGAASAAAGDVLAEFSPAIGKRGGTLAFLRSRDGAPDRIVLHPASPDTAALAEPPPGVSRMRDLHRW